MVTPSPGQHTRCRPKRSTVRTMVVAVNKPTKSSFGILFRSDFDSPVGARDSPRAGSSAPPGVTLQEFLHSFQNLEEISELSWHLVSYVSLLKTSSGILSLKISYLSACENSESTDVYC